MQRRVNFLFRFSHRKEKSWDRIMKKKKKTLRSSKNGRGEGTNEHAYCTICFNFNQTNKIESNFRNTNFLLCKIFFFSYISHIRVTIYVFFPPFCIGKIYEEMNSNNKLLDKSGKNTKYKFQIQNKRPKSCHKTSSTGTSMRFAL